MGCNHEKTVTHLLYVSELLDNWSRNNDALVFLYRVFEAWDEQDSINGNGYAPLSARFPQVTHTQGTSTKTVSRRPRDTFTETNDPARVNHQLSLAKSRFFSGDESAESLLIRLINQCEMHDETLSSQILQAICSLVELYRRMNNQERLTDALDHLREAVYKFLDSTIEKTGDLLKACMKAAQSHLENECFETAEEIFQVIGGEAENTHGTDNKAIINMFIDIGKIYQNSNMWSIAQDWFERALAASMTAYGLEGAITKRLETALENERYSVELPGSKKLLELWI